MTRYSAFSLAARALAGHQNWPRAWRKPSPRKRYDVIIVGAGGHGLATAYYLATRHAAGTIAVLDSGHLGGGNSGRNTQICRSNYFYPESGAFYDHSLRLYETLSLRLNFNIMFSQRGVIDLSHSPEELEMNRRWANAMTLNGIDSEVLTRDDLRKSVPLLNLDCRFPVYGALRQGRGGISRHDAVVWAYARAASNAGVDIIQSCAVNGFEIKNGKVEAVNTTQGRMPAGKVALCVAGNSSHVAALAGLKLPIESMALQAMVTEPVKPVLNTCVASSVIHVYVSQSDRGEIVIGGGADRYNSYAQRGGLPVTQENAMAVNELFPSFGRLRIMRQWAGICDISPDASPIVGTTPIKNLFLSTGWGTGGFKAIPAGGDTLAHTIANGVPHPLLQPFSLQRFSTGQLVDEAAAAGVAH